MVAAWINADTGVGPAIASPNHACKGNCADFPVAASKSMIPIAVSAPCEVPSAASFTPLNETVPIVAKAIMIAKESPISPTRLAINAFFEAVAYAGLWFQKPINK